MSRTGGIWLGYLSGTPAARIRYPDRTGVLYMVQKHVSQHRGCVALVTLRLHQSVSIWDVKEPLTTTNVTTLSASTEMSAWR